ncbi:Maf family protein [Salmonirosea aquatica]|uniref:dTTP/UTP pyrophosphatase n=1 Tax=Salmonirosea aquatica TaxID=2654236 RepID=A0A7C9BE47_9BACT|nr:septum formation protein Maf [Cytophagaceae bacterium SJW1-29]
MITLLTRPLVLASNSPRRRQLLQECGFEFTTEVRPTREEFPASMPAQQVPVYLAQQKAECFRHDHDNRLILCADTIVVQDNVILNKPKHTQEATSMLSLLSGATHRVITGVCLLDGDRYTTATDVAMVTFRRLQDREIERYIEQCRPYDKAGGYGIQEWIGMVGIERIEGSYYTIMGLPTHLVYDLLKPYFAE